jgi:hypothetical protein
VGLFPKLNKESISLVRAIFLDEPFIDGNLLFGGADSGFILPSR